MHYKLMFPSKYLKAQDLGDSDVTLTIRSIAKEYVKKSDGNGGYKDVGMWVMYFHEIHDKLIARDANKDDMENEKRLIPNVTNATVISDIHGEDNDEWIDKKITLYQTKVRVGREFKPAIRVREK